MKKVTCSFFTNSIKRWQLLALLLLGTLSLVSAQKPVPELWGFRVHDEAHVLKQETIDQLELALQVYEDSTSNQIAVLTITSLDGEVLEDYSLRVAETWKLGTDKNDNGVLLLVAIEDRAMRIEVGHGLEGVLTDAQCNRIIRNEMAPAFRRGDYDAGIVAGILGITASIGGEYTASETLNDESANEIGWVVLVLVSIFVFGILGVFTVAGLFSKGFMAWVLYVFLALFYGTFPMALYGTKGGLAVFLTYLISYPIIKIYLNRHPKWKNKMAEWQSSGSGSWSTGGGSSRSGGGSSFSGGGGSFGGGGSSGRW